MPDEIIDTSEFSPVTPAEVEEAMAILTEQLGPEDAAAMADLFGCTEE